MNTNNSMRPLMTGSKESFEEQINAKLEEVTEQIQVRMNDLEDSLEVKIRDIMAEVIEQIRPMFVELHDEIFRQQNGLIHSAEVAKMLNLSMIELLECAELEGLPSYLLGGRLYWIYDDIKKLQEERDGSNPNPSE